MYKLMDSIFVEPYSNVYFLRQLMNFCYYRKNSWHIQECSK